MVTTIRLAQTQQRQRQYKEVWALRLKGVPIPELCRQFNISKRTVHRIMEREGIYQNSQYPIPIEPEPVELPDPRETYRRKAPLRLSQHAHRLFLKACRRCGGDVAVDALYQEAKCLQCANTRHRKAVEA